MTDSSIAFGLMIVVGIAVILYLLNPTKSVKKPHAKQATKASKRKAKRRKHR